MTLRADTETTVPAPVDVATRRVFAWLTALRGERVFHPLGAAFAGTARLTDRAVGLMGDRSEMGAIVRVSRGIGVRHPLPDFNGIAVRLLDAHGTGLHQDLLLVSSSRSPLARHLLLPFPFLSWSGYSSISPYRTPDGLRMFGAPPLQEATIEGLEGSMPFDVHVDSAPLFGPWERMVDITLSEPLDAATGTALRFDPWRTSAQLVPAGLLNRLRLPAYAGSQGAREP